jgi:hypothetical protein
MEEYNSQILIKLNSINNSIIPMEKQKIFIIRKIKRSQVWTKEEDVKLKALAERFKCHNWKEIAKNLGNRSAIQCCSRYKRIRPGIIKGLWTETEDKLVLNLVNKFGRNWSLLSRYMPRRTGKQIRERFINILDPAINRDKFTFDEDRYILELYSIYGTTWSKIAEFLKNRTADMVKNRFYSYLHRNIHGDCYKDQLNRRKKRMAGVFNNDVIRKKKKLFKVDLISVRDKQMAKENCEKHIKINKSVKDYKYINKQAGLNSFNNIEHTYKYANNYNLGVYNENSDRFLKDIENFNSSGRSEQNEEIKLDLTSLNANHSLNFNSTYPIDNNFKFDQTQAEPMRLLNQYNRLYELYFKSFSYNCTSENKSNCGCFECKTMSEFRNRIHQQIINLNNILQVSYLK